MSQKKILLIDNKNDFCFFVKLNLEKTGRYEVLTATSGNEGIGLAKSHKPDLITLDIMMPQMDGGQVAAILLGDESTRSIPIVFLTALVQKEEILKRGGRIGDRNFIAKPVTPEELIEQIELYLNPSRGSA